MNHDGLKPCPFCDEGKHLYFVYTDRKRRWWYVQCGNCGANCGARRGDDIETAKNHARFEWNQRWGEVTQ